MAAYRRVYDSRHLQADYQEPGSAPEPYTLGNRVWATFTLFYMSRAINRYVYRLSFRFCDAIASALHIHEWPSTVIANKWPWRR